MVLGVEQCIGVAIPDAVTLKAPFQALLRELPHVYVHCVMFKMLKNHKMAFSYENNIEFMSLLLSSWCVRH